MAKYRYTGGGNRVFPSLGLTVKSGDEFEAPDNFIAVGVVKVENPAPQFTKKAEKPKEPEIETESDSSDESAGE